MVIKVIVHHDILNPVIMYLNCFTIFWRLIFLFYCLIHYLPYFPVLFWRKKNSLQKYYCLSQSQKDKQYMISLYEVPKVVKSVKTESKILVAKVWEKGGMSYF